MKVQPKQYAKLLYEITVGQTDQPAVDASIKKLAGIIQENRDKSLLDKIIVEYDRLYNEKQGIVEAEVISARELTGQQLGQSKKAIAEKFQTKESNVHLSTIVQPEIKGGVIVKIGNEVWDGSVRSKLQRLKAQLS